MPQQLLTGLPMSQKHKRIHILTAVNARNVSKSGSTYTIRDVSGAVDDIVMNGMLYPGQQLAAGAPSLEGKPAPAGHPKNASGQHISALNGEALLNSYAGAVCRNARHEGGRTLVDIIINEQQARSHVDGSKLLERLDNAISGKNVEPIHVSTGLVCAPITANGESRGKKYERIATAIQYDHLAILLNEKGAGTPDDGVGMWLNAAGEPEQVEQIEVNAEPEDRRGAGLLASMSGWVRKLLGNGSDLSFDQISDGLYKGLAEGSWLREVFDRYAIWTDRDGKLWRQDYTVSSDGSVAWSGTAVEVTRKVTYEPITNAQKGDQVKEHILAALNAAGISVAGKTDEQLLADFEALKVKPHTDALTAANSKIAGFEAAARAAEEAEVTALATELSVNSSLTVDDLKKLGAPRLRELKAAAKPGQRAAPVITGNASGGADEFAGYDLNSHITKE